MKTLNFYIIALMAAATFCMSGCNNDDDDRLTQPRVDASPANTPLDLLTSQTWRGSQFISDGKDASEDFILSSGINRMSDFTVKFEKEGNFSMTLDTLLIGIWQFADTDNRIVVDADTFDIAKLSASDLHLRQIAHVSTPDTAFTSTTEIRFVH